MEMSVSKVETEMEKWMRRKMTSSFFVVCKNCWENSGHIVNERGERKKNKHTNEGVQDGNECVNSCNKNGKIDAKENDIFLFVVCKNCWEKYRTHSK